MYYLYLFNSHMKLLKYGLNYFDFWQGIRFMEAIAINQFCNEASSQKRQFYMRKVYNLFLTTPYKLL